MKMKNEKFNQAIDEIVGFIVDVQQLQMDQLKCNIKTAYGATIHETDPHAIAEMIMNLPVESVQSREIQFKCEGCTDCKGDHKVISKDPVIEEGQFGDIWDLSRIQNEGNVPYGFDFYHHCPEVQDDLVRLNYHNDTMEHICPLCNGIFLSKDRPKAFHE